LEFFLSKRQGISKCEMPVQPLFFFTLITYLPRAIFDTHPGMLLPVLGEYQKYPWVSLRYSSLNPQNITLNDILIENLISGSCSCEN
jgi:hypothetical protein